MRSRLAPIAMILLSAVAITARAAAASPPRTATALPKLIVGSYTGIKPKLIDFSGDAGNIVTGLKWTWTSTSAVGHGTSDIQGCVPNCAEGSETAVKATITLSAVRDGHFTKMVEVREGERLVAHYETDTWPPGASQH